MTKFLPFLTVLLFVAAIFQVGDSKKLSFEEKESIKQLMNQLDMNGDGKVSLGEAKIVTSKNKDSLIMFLFCDFNHDGQLTSQEIIKCVESVPDQLFNF